MIADTMDEEVLMIIARSKPDTHSQTASVNDSTKRSNKSSITFPSARRSIQASRSFNTILTSVSMSTTPNAQWKILFRQNTDADVSGLTASCKRKNA
jgi:hypothetical protein